MVFKRIMLFLLSFIVIAFAMTLCFYFFQNLVNPLGFAVLSVICLFTIVGLLLLWRYDVVTFKRLTIRDLGISIGFMVLGLLVTVLLSAISPMESASSQYLSHLFQNSVYWPIIGYIAIVGPITEEFSFRGLMQAGGFHNSWTGIVTSSTLFALYHGPEGLMAFLNYFLAGVILGYAYRLTNNFYVPMIIHILNNSLAVFLLVYVL